MPLIEVSSFGLTDDTKRKLIVELANKASEVTSIDLEFFTVIFREVAGGHCYVHTGKLVEDIYRERQK